MKNLEILAEFNFKTHIEIRFSDFDLQGHVNNALYLTYFEQARIKYWQHFLEWDWTIYGIVVAKAEVNYITPLLIGDKIEVHVRTSKLNNTSFQLDYIIVSTNKEGKTTITTKGSTLLVVIDIQKQKPVAIPQLQRNQIINFDKLEA